MTSDGSGRMRRSRRADSSLAFRPQHPNLRDRVLGSLTARPWSAADVDVRTRTSRPDRVDQRAVVVDAVELVSELLIVDAIADLEEVARRCPTGEQREIRAKRKFRIARNWGSGHAFLSAF